MVSYALIMNRGVTFFSITQIISQTLCDEQVQGSGRAINKSEDQMRSSVLKICRDLRICYINFIEEFMTVIP